MLIGNVGKDPEIRHLESGTAVANITLATTKGIKTGTENYRNRRNGTTWYCGADWLM